MNEKNGISPRPNGGAANRSPHFTDLRKTAAQPRVNVDKYRPAREIEATQRFTFDTSEQPEAIAVAVNDPNWQDNPLMRNQDDRDISGSEDYYPATTSDAPDGSEFDGIDEHIDLGDEDQQPDDGKPPRRNPFAALIARIKGMSRKQWLLVISIILILGAGITSYILTRPDTAEPVRSVQKAKKPVPAKPTSPLTGVEVSEEDSKRPVIGVMIENSTFARPQAGLKDAGVIYEAISEYGITRFLSLYQEAAPGNIGPIRSARPYYVDWVKSYDAAYGHVGGSPEALAKIKTDGVRDMDQFANAGAYHRISQRQAPHNMYSSAQKLRELADAKGYDSSTFKAWERKKDTAEKTPDATSIDIAISGATYNVHYDYDAESNSYKRVMGGSPHKDGDTGAQLAPKVVIGLATQYGVMADGYHSTYVTTGSGVAKIYQDGSYTEATWKREGNDTYAFTDKEGKAIKLNAGQTWITVVGNPTAIRHTGPAPAAPAQ